MRITELLQDATIDLGVKVNSKEEAIDHLVDLFIVKYKCRKLQTKNVGRCNYIL